MSKLLEILKNPGAQIAVLVGFLVMVSAGIWGFYLTQVPPPQPIQFPHKTHVNFQIPCLYCHPGAWRQASAGLPTEQKCWACHGQLKKYFQPPVPVENWPVELQKLNTYVQENKPIKWVPVYQVPDFVHFNHRPHIAAGLNCENCHGDMSKKTVATLEQTVNMGWCINCHKAKSADDPVLRTKLLDCGTCHY
ncbi:MAG TPA: cytochrome c3 family protein [Anaerolineales bacterium]|jgi:hypothetical protein